MRALGIFVLVGLLCGCVNGRPAPVVNAWLDPQARQSDYLVYKGDTIYSIAWQFGLDYAALAKANHLQPPYAIHPGQRLKMTIAPRGFAEKEPISSSPSISPLHPLPPPPPPQPSKISSSWQWPAKGTLVRGYSPTLIGNPGINIAGRLGSPVRASQAGEVVYCGDGIRGYGNLIIIKHNRHYLSAYAYNQDIQVKLGQNVHDGERIATMGHDDSGQVLLHFEIRYDGHPIDPLTFLR